MTILEGCFWLEKYFHIILESSKQENVFSEYKTKYSFTLLFLEITEKIASLQRKTLPILNRKLDFSEPIIEKEQRKFQIEAFLHSCYHKHITLKDLSEYMYLSPKQTDRIVKEVTGMNFGSLILKHRMAIAKNILLYSNIAIKDIAQMVGYDSYNGFYVTFKQFYGKTPEMFRKDMTTSLAGGHD